MEMVDFNYNNFTHESLELEKKKLILQLKEESISKDGMEFWAKAEKIQEQYEDPYRRSEYTSRKLFTQFKKEAETESELQFWTKLEQMRGAYRYPEDGGFICEDIDEETEDKAEDIQTGIDSEQLESYNGQDEAGNKQDNLNKEQDETMETEQDKQNKIAETTAINQDITQKAVEPSSLMSVAQIHQKEDPTWIDISLKNDIELDIPDINERKIMEKEEKKKEKRTNKLIKADKKRKQKEINQSKKKQTKDERKKAKKSTFSDFMRSLTSCFWKPKKVEEK
ncbi:DNA ligase 1-like [Mytilus edulis]|uniref:DNA ligase 1-like n=1 Tax=Mytilus edulis TaxID=6550 RepID=UPI0039EF387E